MEVVMLGLLVLVGCGEGDTGAPEEPARLVVVVEDVVCDGAEGWISREAPEGMGAGVILDCFEDLSTSQGSPGVEVCRPTVDTYALMSVDGSSAHVLCSEPGLVYTVRWMGVR